MSEGLKNLLERALALALDGPKGHDSVFQADLCLKPCRKIAPKIVDGSAGLSRKAVEKAHHGVPVVVCCKGGKEGF
jgi:hypothetical protein